MVRVVSLRAENFRRLNLAEPLEFPGRLVIIRGRNEAGKSTILEAILFGIYGDFRIPSALRGGRQGLESLVNHRAGRARVEVVFEVGGRRYRVERIVESRGGEAHQIEAKLVELTGGGWRVIATGVSRVNESVQRILRVSWREMLAANVIAQKDLERILRMERSERERIINMMMGLESYNKAIERLRDEAAERERALESVREKLKALAGRVEELEEKGRRLEEWAAELRGLEERLPQLEEAAEREELAYRYLEELEAALRRKRELKLRLELLQREKADVERRLEEVKSRSGAVALELEGLLRERAELELSLREAGRELEAAEGELRRLIELRARVEELWNNYLSTQRELEGVRIRVSALVERLRGREELERRVNAEEERLASVEKAASSARLPAWSVAGAVGIAALSVAAAALLHPAALAGLTLAALALLAGLQAKHRLLYELSREASELRERISSLNAELRVLERDEVELESLNRREGELRERLNALWLQLSTAAESAGAGRPETAVSEVARLAAAAEARRGEASMRYNALNVRLSELAATIRARESEVARLGREIEALSERLEELASSTRELEEGLLRIAVPEPPLRIEELPWPATEERVETVSRLRLERWERYRSVQAELERVRSAVEELKRRVEEAKEELQRLPELRAELAKLEEEARSAELEVRARRAAIDALRKVSERRRAVFAPSVESNMSWIVSYITNGRYKAIRIDPQSYEVEVYDAEAGSWMRRDIYSGGTNDQFLLAMRIAFILSLLPAAKGTYPKFLFLDEPLGSSDAERRERIVNLLSRELTRLFDQLFLVTHVDVNEPAGSTVIVMEDGRPERVYGVGATEESE